MKKLKLGDKVICTRDARKRWWKKGKIYDVVKSKKTGKLVVLDEEEDEREIRIVEHYLNRDLMLKFELIKEVNKMKYTENDLELGDKLLCTKSEVEHWTLGKMYELKLNKIGVLEIKDDDGDEAYSSYILESLNKEWDLVEFELIKKEENNMQEIKVGDLVEVVVNDSGAWKSISERFKPGDRAIVSKVSGNNIKLGNDDNLGSLMGKREVKKVDQTPELSEYEEELVLRLAEEIEKKDKYLKQIQQFKNNIRFNENELEKTQKQIKEITKKLLTK